MSLARPPSTRLQWLQNRQKGIGSSDAASIMGVSPWRTILDIYNDKVADVIVWDTTNQYAKDRGNEIEPKVRALFEKRAGVSYAPANIVHPEHPHLMASLDGRTEDGTSIIEIKWSALRDWRATKDRNAIPSKYFPQLQHQLLVSQCSCLFFLSYPWSKDVEETLNPDKLAMVLVYPDFEYQRTLLKRENEFWFNHVIPRIPPVVESVFKPLQEDPPMWGTPTTDKLEVAAKDWLRLDAEIKALEEKRELCRAVLLEAAVKSGFDKLECHGVKLVKQTRLGNVDYSKIEALKDIDLEPYRKEATTFWRFATGN